MSKILSIQSKLYCANKIEIDRINNMIGRPFEFAKASHYNNRTYCIQNSFLVSLITKTRQYDTYTIKINSNIVEND